MRGRPRGSFHVHRHQPRLDEEFSCLRNVDVALAASVDLSTMNTVGDLQGGIEEAERLLGFKVTRAVGAEA